VLSVGLDLLLGVAETHSVAKAQALALAAAPGAAMDAISTASSLGMSMSIGMGTGTGVGRVTSRRGGPASPARRRQPRPEVEGEQDWSQYNR
jgi:hypothetical protein